MKVKGLTLKKVVSTRTAELRIQDNVKPFDNVLVRQALNYAVDIPSIIKNVFHGYGKPNNGQTIGSFALAGGWQPQLKPYPHDPAKAKSLLAKAGYPSGFSTQIGTPMGKDPGDYEFVQAVSGYLKAVGIDAEVVLHEIGQYESMYSGLTPADPLFYYSSGNFIPNVENALVDYLTPSSFQVHDATVTKLYNKLTHTVDARQRAAIARQVQTYLRTTARPSSAIRSRACLRGIGPGISGRPAHISTGSTWTRSSIAAEAASGSARCIACRRRGGVE